MTNESPGGIPAPDTTSLAELVTGANALLYYAITTGRTITPEISDPILRLRRLLGDGTVVSAADERAFLDAYSRLAALVAPVTAATLRTTSRDQRPRIWLGRVLSLRSLSEAQRASFLFGFLAMCLLVVVGIFEAQRSLIAIIVSGQTEYAKIVEESRTTRLGLRALGAQSGPSEARAQSREGVSPSLLPQYEELTTRLARLEDQETRLGRVIQAAYETLDWMMPFVRWSELRNIIAPVANLIGGFLLPPVYGALGTCTYILRSIHSQMISRSYDPRRSGEFMVRIFLGMLSGMTLQWLFVREGAAVAGGITPAVLAFLGGYSVEVLFTALDRLLAALRGSARGGGRVRASASSAPGGGSTASAE